MQLIAAAEGASSRGGAGAAKPTAKSRSACARRFPHTSSLRRAPVNEVAFEIVGTGLESRYKLKPPAGRSSQLRPEEKAREVGLQAENSGYQVSRLNL